MNADDCIEAKLDYGLEMTFPASDPFTVYIPEVRHDGECALGAHRSELQAAA
jgi:hypothetical protein